jgi:hypothetical protein
MVVIETPQVGDVGLVRVKGLTGWFIDLGQELNGSKEVDAKFEHALMYTGDSEALEGQPGGAVIDSLAGRYGSREITWVRPLPGIDQDQMSALVAEATRLVGTKYSFLDYAALAIKRFHLPVPGVEKRVISTKHMICSQIIVEVYRNSGVANLFPGRPSGYVTPADYAVFR